eukprot:COSAG06_NODE_2953_length_6035_cov_1.884156_5_plen_129_part_00
MCARTIRQFQVASPSGKRSVGGNGQSLLHTCPAAVQFVSAGLAVLQSQQLPLTTSSVMNLPATVFSGPNAKEQRREAEAEAEEAAQLRVGVERVVLAWAAAARRCGPEQLGGGVEQRLRMLEQQQQQQ